MSIDMQSRFECPNPSGIWTYGQDGEVLNVHWNEEGEIEIISFKRGDWEEEILGAAQVQNASTVLN